MRCVGRREIYLTFIEIIDAFTFYGIDVILLAAATAGLTQLIKKFLFKRLPKKLVTFLPFIIGSFLYAVYASVKNLDPLFFLTNYVSVLEHGISVGAVSTLVYVLYEQFVREKNNLNATEKIISTLIEGYIPERNVEEAAKAVAEAIEKDVTGNGADKTEKILLTYGGENISERDIGLLSRMIIETLASLAAKNDV